MSLIGQMPRWTEQVRVPVIGMVKVSVDQDGMAYKASWTQDGPRSVWAQTPAQAIAKAQQEAVALVNRGIGATPPETPDDYVRKIRNRTKRSYAERWLAYCRSTTSSGRAGAPFPPSSGDISGMAAQAVRMRLAELGAREP